MKKIVAVALATSMVAVSAFADASFSVNYRTGIEVLKHETKSNTHLLNGATSSRATSDALSFKGKAEYGGLELEIDPTQLYNNTYDVTVTKDGKTTTVSGIFLKKYNGWINFGDFMFKSGSWDSRAVGRVNADLGNHEGKFWGELAKPGLANKFGTTGNGQDISQQNGTGKISNMLAYTNKDLGIEARGAFIESADDSYAGDADDNDDWVFDNDAWFAEVGYTVKGLGRVLVNAKTSYKDQAFGIFVEPKLAELPALTSLVGFTFERDYSAKYTSGDKAGDTCNEYALGFDLRARYVINDQLSVTGMYNWSAGDVINSNGNGKDGKYATWGMLNAKYVLNETLSPFCSVIYSSGNVSSAGALKFTDSYKASLRFYPGVEIYNTANANICTGIVVDLQDFTGDDNAFTKTITVPVLMKVKF